jgi:hypothetical protein
LAKYFWGINKRKIVWGLDGPLPYGSCISVSSSETVLFACSYSTLHFRFPKLVNNQMVQELTSQQYFTSTQAIKQV